MDDFLDVVWIVSYKGIDGEHYKTVVKEKTAYRAVSAVAGLVNGNQNFGMDFKVEVHPTI